MQSKNIVLLHGWGASVSRMTPLATELEKLGWKVFVPKIPGFDGKDPSKVWRLDDYRKYLIEKSDNYFSGRKYYLFGHSFGGRVAIKAATKAKNIAGIILCGAGGISRGSLAKRIAFGTIAKLGKIIFFVIPGKKQFKKVLYKLAREHDYEKTSGVMRDTFKNVVSENLKPLVSMIFLPTLILWGEDDRLTPVTDSYFLKKKIPNSEIEIYPKEGHTLYFDKAKEIARRINIWFKTLS